MKFDDIVGYRKGIYLQLKEGNIPNASLEVDVSSQFRDGDKVRVYFYDEANKKVSLKESSLTIKGGKISIPLVEGGQYFVTKAFINKNDGFNVYQIVSIIELFALVVSLFYIIGLKRKMN